MGKRTSGPRGTATGIRTPVSAVRGRRPSPLDDGGLGRPSLASGPGAPPAAPRASLWSAADLIVRLLTSRLAALAVAAGLVAGCGHGGGGRDSNAGARVLVTMDQGDAVIADDRFDPVGQGDTVLGLLRARHAVGGDAGGAVRTVDRVAGRDGEWRWFVNGVPGAGDPAR